MGWLTPQASEYLYDPRGLHKRDVHVKPLVVQRPVSTLGSIFGFVENEKLLHHMRVDTHNTY